MGYDDIQSGSLIDYQFDWHQESLRGEIEGRKSRPCAVVLRLRNSFVIMPVTTKRPNVNTLAISFPEIEAERLHLERGIERWVIIEEINIDEIPSYVMEPNAFIGQLSKSFGRQLVEALRQNAKKMKVTNRKDQSS